VRSCALLMVIRTAPGLGLVLLKALKTLHTMSEEGPGRKEKAVLRVDPEFTALIPHLPPLNRKFIF
jgi:hypothetical protein